MIKRKILADSKYFTLEQGVDQNNGDRKMFLITMKFVPDLDPEVRTRLRQAYQRMGGQRYQKHRSRKRAEAAYTMLSLMV